MLSSISANFFFRTTESIAGHAVATVLHGSSSHQYGLELRFSLLRGHYKHFSSTGGKSRAGITLLYIVAT